jgi:V/A-type H+-transporting ATPase subunit C
MEKDYTYGVARIRALESNLFSDETMANLLQCDSFEECMNFLRDVGWGNQNLEQSLDEMLDYETAKTKQVLSELTENDSQVDILNIADEFHNLKAAIKQVCTEEETKNVFYTHCKLDLEFVKECIRQGQYSSLPENMMNPAKEATEILLKTGNGQLCDMIIDKAALEAIKLAGEQSDNSLVKKYADAQVAISDIKIAVRCAKTHKDSSFVINCLVPCAGVNISELAMAVDGGIDSVCDYLEMAGYSQAVEALKSSTSVFECWCDNKIIEDIKPEKYNSFTIGPIIAYVIARQMEIKTVKIILSGKLNGFDNDFIRERIRIMYV